MGQLSPSAGVFRRLGAMIYDCLPLFALLVAATLPFLPFVHGRVLVAEEVGLLAYIYRLVQLLVIGGFFLFFWTRRGQTLGMLAWRLRLQRPDGTLVSWPIAVRRMLCVLLLWLPLLLGYWLVWRHWPDRTARIIANTLSLLPLVLAYVWIWIDRDRLAWHDRWTGTRVIVLPKRKK